MKTQQHLLALPPGYRLGKYRLEGVLGSGGFGITYLAYDPSLGRKVAIKELLPNNFATRVDGSTVVAKTESDNADLEWARKRFLDEGRVLASCSHPNVVEVYDMVEANRTVYMVTKYEEGQDLERWLRGLGRQPAQYELREILLALLSGLEQVHLRGFLHRDIKPENIYLTENGRPVLLDFGSARQAISNRSRMLTAIITPGYAPFEQYHEGGGQGPWSDIYGLGAVMYRAIMGAKPPEAIARLMGNDPYQRLAGVRRGQYDDRFLQAIDRALEIKQSDRPQDVKEWRAMLIEDAASAQQREKERTEAERRQRERLEAEAREKERLEAKRREREGQKRVEQGPQSPPSLPGAPVVPSIVPSTIPGKRKLHPVAAVLGFLALVLGLGAGVGIYFGSRHPEPKPTEFQTPSRPSFGESTPVAITTPPPTHSTFIPPPEPSAAESLAEAQRYIDAKDFEKAVPLLEKAADAGNGFAMEKLGALYRDGQGVRQDYAKAREWYEKAANGGSAEAMTNLGVFYEYGQGVTQNFFKAREWYQKGADAGSADAMNGLGALYADGQGGDRDYVKAFEWFQKSAEGGNAAAKCNMGLMYSNGQGVPQDNVKAREWFQKSADAGYIKAMYDLGWVYANGKGANQDYVKASEWYQKAVDGGDANAMFNLALLYEDGQGVTQDYVKARELLERSANAGNAGAMTSVGWLYANGKGVARDYLKAREWYEKAIDGGDSMGMNNLGWLYENGQGVSRDYAKAREWFQKAADAGNTKAMENMALLYVNGKGVSQDYGKAREWFQKAAAAGDEVAKRALSDLRNRH
jgi:TPR repeat protein/serine/threonine protein kinase